MKTSKVISDANYQIQMMKKNLPYIKDQQRLDRYINSLNVFIKLLNAADSLMVERRSSDVVEKLLLTRLRGYLQQVLISREKISLEDLVWKVDTDLRFSTDLVKQEVVQLVKDIEIAQLFKSVKRIKKENAVELEARFKSILKSDVQEGMVSQLIKELTDKISWN